MSDEHLLPDTSAGYGLYLEGRSAMDAGNFQLAVEKFTRAAVLAPHFKTYELAGECLLADHRPTEAALYLAAAAGLGDKQSRARYLLAKALIELDQREWALRQLREALALQPHYRAASVLMTRLVAESSTSNEKSPS